jgi:hypothetical protein
MSQRYLGGYITASYNPLLVPNAPTIGTATVATTTSISVPFTAPANVGGGVITGYRATARDSSSGALFSVSGASSPIVITGLTTGNTYTATVVAINAYGTGPASAASNSVIPQFIYPGTLSTAYFVRQPQSSTERYIYSGDTVATGTALTFSMGTGSAAGNSLVGIFARGDNNTTTSKYTYAANTTAAGTSFVNTNGALSYSSATGNSTRGIFTLGSSSSPGGQTYKYTYSDDTVSSGANTQTSGVVSYGFIGCAAGNSTFGIFANGAGPTNDIRWKYTYSGDSVVNTTSSSVGNYYGAAVGPSTYGIFAIGYNTSLNAASTITNKFTYSSESSDVSTSLTTGGAGMAAGGGNSVGIFVIGNGTATTNKWTYSGDTVVAGTSLAGGIVNAAVGASNGTTGVNA